MGSIDQGSRRMADITGVIEGIAFQTNILALNAAVEAARAGEQGRGFAVVASEVRALAQRSAEAAKEIRALIERSVGEISNGSRKAERAGTLIDEIVASVHAVSELIGQIAVSSTQQSAGLHEINKAILQLENVTQQNSALVQEGAASSHMLREQAEALRNLVARFKIAGEARPTGEQSAAACEPPMMNQEVTGTSGAIRQDDCDLDEVDAVRELHRAGVRGLRAGRPDDPAPVVVTDSQHRGAEPVGEIRVHGQSPVKETGANVVAARDGHEGGRDGKRPWSGRRRRGQGVGDRDPRPKPPRKSVTAICDPMEHSPEVRIVKRPGLAETRIGRTAKAAGWETE
jgi:hypothetical protein